MNTPETQSGGSLKSSSDLLGEILECLSLVEWALTDAINRDRTGWLQENARDEARAMLKKCAEMSPNDQAHT